MFKARQRATQATEPVEADTFLSLEQLDRRIGGRGHAPSDAVVMRESARLLELMAGERGACFATLVCERGERGTRIAQGGEALVVARMLRSRALLRGDEMWARLLGERVYFRVVQRSAPARAPKRRGLPRQAARVARLAMA